MQPNISKLKNGSDRRKGEMKSHTNHSCSMPKNMKWLWKTSTDTSPTEELQQQQQKLMKSEPSNTTRKVTITVMAIEPRVVQVKHAANAAHLTHQENAQHLVETVISVEIRITSVLSVGWKRAKEMAKNQHEVEVERCHRPKGRCSKSRSRSRSSTRNTHSIELMKPIKTGMILDLKHSTLLTDPSQFPASAMKWIQMA